MKKIYLNLPEYYLIIITFLMGYSYPFNINPFFLLIVGVLILQLIFKNTFTGIFIGVTFFILNLLFLGALLSELNEFIAFNSKAKQLFFGGLLIWIFNMLFSLLLIFKYLKNKNNLKFSF